MKTVVAHRHAFAEQDWPFSDPQNALAISTRQVFYEGLPVLCVSHDEDGDWQVLCNTTRDVKDLMVACLACAFERDRSIGELAEMPRGWFAERTAAGAPWVISKIPPEDEES